MGKPPVQAAASAPLPDREDPAPPSASSADGPSVALSLPHLLRQPWTENPALSGSCLVWGNWVFPHPRALCSWIAGWAGPPGPISAPRPAAGLTRLVFGTQCLWVLKRTLPCLCMYVYMYMGVHVRVCMCMYVCALPTSLSNPETCLWEEVRSGITILKISP